MAKQELRSVRITVMRQTVYPDLMAAYEQPLEEACNMQVGQVFVAEAGQRPAGFCQSAWESMAQFVEALAAGGGNFYGAWMQNPHAAMISCNDGFRPVSFLLETVEE